MSDTYLPASRQLLNITKAALDHAEAECERLREEIGQLKASDFYLYARNSAIEECAVMIRENYGTLNLHELIAAIRALKEKP